MNSERLLTKPRFSTFSSFGLLTAIVVFVVFIPFFILEVGRHHAMGLTVHVLTPGALETSADQQQPVFVRIRFQSSKLEPALYVDSELVSWQELAPTLKDYLKSKPRKIVYLEGDPELKWADVVKVIDTIRGVPAEVVLITALIQD